jgi:hypothetical protein
MCDRKKSISVLVLAPGMSTSCWIGECKAVDGLVRWRTGGVLCESMGNVLKDGSATGSADMAVCFHIFCSEAV